MEALNLEKTLEKTLAYTNATLEIQMNETLILKQKFEKQIESTDANPIFYAKCVHNPVDGRSCNVIIDIGNGFDKFLQRYNAPIAGIYSIQVASSNILENSVCIFLNGNQYTKEFANPKDGLIGLDIQLIMPLIKNDQVSFSFEGVVKKDVNCTFAVIFLREIRNPSPITTAEKLSTTIEASMVPKLMQFQKINYQNRNGVKQGTENEQSSILEVNTQDNDDTYDDETFDNNVYDDNYNFDAYFL